ncbi:EAL domain-containing protein [Solirubrobacter sp. CPCC 204708]|uniref:EAL domain-containing protein n=1 Tax=Solirubrobacter deserti TaxID=2282478 RepID=A0ABT4RP37_9ACTN|nr:EAL domain-containing protein [Solirubrobacter deserti]MBE2317493.1 EAL domain-containing protein [Solirubrobacter deserti]MDA0140329.1 EAL domain-containing protein [Solirubrobacter deserti]
MRVLAVAADDAHHAPICALLKHAQIDHVHTADEAHTAVAANAYDVILVDREIAPPGADGLTLATELVGTPAPVIVLSHHIDKPADARAAEAGIADFLHIAGLSTDRLEHSVRYALTHQRALDRLKASEERSALAHEGSGDGLWDWDVTADRVHYSPRWKALLGYRDCEIGEQRGEWLGRVHPDDRAPLTQALDAFVSGAAERFEFEHRVQHRDSTYRWMLSRATAVRDSARKATRVVGTITDTTDRRESERRLQHDALHDALTGLPNRVLFLDRLDQSIRRAQRRHPATCAAVLFLDLDRFKVINDSLGHASGDQLLQKVARRLEAALRPNDTVARLSGDEFTLLLDDVSDPREATVIAERVLQSLKAPFVIDNRELFIDSSIGIALATAKSSPEQVMRDADVAMYRAKADGKGRHAVFDAAMHQQVMRRLDLEGDLRRAVETNALEVVYQPITQAATGRVVGFEASCRWPTGEPAEVLAMADETGLSIPLGRQVLETACAQLAQWRLLPRGAGLTIGVNVSARQLSEPGFIAMLDEILRTTHLDPRALRLEVSEHDLSRGRADDATRRVLDQALEQLSVRTHIDDFGTGASPLRLLHRFPGDAIKVSRALVAGIGMDAGAFEIVRAVVGLAHNLGLEVIADGVEKREQLDYLKVLGCEFAQGFHISAPLSAGEARAMLESGVLA